jgi:2-oxoglutarate dehydrogenase E1 component
MRMPFRKPLIVIAPKKLLKFKGAASPIEDFAEGNRFKLALFDTNPNLVAPEKVRKVIMCSGQVYYDLDDARHKNGDNEVAIIRLESLCPFPFKEIIRELQKYKNASITWAQEEPKNAGAWYYVEPRLRNVCDWMKKSDNEIDYAGRPMMAAAAVGYTSTHQAQLKKLLEDAMK